MTPVQAGDARTTLIEAAARVLAEHGPESLTTRRLASEVGTSTMVVYTHFGSMPELRRAIREEGFARLGRQWSAVETSRDPVADLSVSGARYVEFALSNPHLYRAMFFEGPIEQTQALVASIAGPRVELIQRCMDCGRFNDTDPASILWQLWAATHGVVAGVHAGVLTLEAAQQHLYALGINLYVGFGDNRPAARRSLNRARAREGARQSDGLTPPA